MHESRAHALHRMHGVLHEQAREAEDDVDLTDILRAEVVLALSGLDFFVHELTRLGMLECWSNERQRPDAFGRFQLPISSVNELMNPEAAEAALDIEIRRKHSFLTFQHPDKIAEAVRLFSNIKLWEAVAQHLRRQPNQVKASLSLIVDRRNKIAHEADIDPSFPGLRWPIDPAMVEGIFDEIEEIGRAIFSVASAK
jgi:hypothetical protein